MKLEEVMEISRRENIRYFRIEFTDILGQVKNVEIPHSSLDKALHNRLMFDGSSIEGFLRIKEADMYLRPDPDTFMMLPFEDSSLGKVARLVADVYNVDGTPFCGDPRGILKRMIKEYEKEGYQTFNIGFEPEFYLLKRGNDGYEPTDNGSYFDMSPIDGSESVRREIALELEKIGFKVGPSHHEVGPGQNEVNFEFSDALKAADNLATFKHVVKTIAYKNGYVATFMPKPFRGKPGNGMHLNCSISDSEGHNLFSGTKGKISLLAERFIGGVIKHALALSALTNSTINSYKRLNSGFEAPKYIAWSYANRSAMIRIPGTYGHESRVEIRSVDALCNSYLTIACIMAAGLDGIKNPEYHVKDVGADLFSLSFEERCKLGVLSLPTSLTEALEEYLKDDIIRKTLGEYTFNKYYEAKRREWEEYEREVHPYELTKYLNF